MSRREEILSRQQELITAAETASRAMTEAEQQEFDTLQREFEALDANGGSGGQPNVGTKSAEDIQRELENERKRSADILALCRNFGLEAEDYIRSGKSLDVVRQDVLDKLQKDKAPVGMRVLADEGDKFRESAADGILLRAGVKVESPADGATNMQGMSLRDLAIESMAREGEDYRTLIKMSRDEIYSMACRQYYNPTSAFPAILDTAIKKSLVEAYDNTPTTFEKWTSEGTLSDFKESADHEYVMGSGGTMPKVPESGELKSGMMQTEKMPNRKLEMYGESFTMSRKAFVNDDIGFITAMPAKYATKAKMTIDKLVYELIYANNKIFDGTPLFDEKHKNVVASASKPTQEMLQNMILQLQKQTDPFGNAIYVVPKHVVVPVGYGFDLHTILHSAQVVGSANNDANPLYNYPIDVIETPQLNALANGKAVPWFLVADHRSAMSVQVDYLNGNKKPTIRRSETAGVLGFTWDVYFDAGVSVRDYRGIVRNNGAVIK